MFFNIALRNVFRNKRRTAISVGVVALGVAILFIVFGFVSSSLATTKESLSRLYGTVQVGNPVLFETSPSSFIHFFDEALADQVIEILNDDERVLGYKKEITFSGLVGSRSGVTLLSATAYDPDNTVEDFDDLIVEGGPLDKARTDEQGRNRTIILGRALADSLNPAREIEEGDEYWKTTILANTYYGSMNSATMEVEGVFKFNDLEMEGQLGFIPLDYAQRFLSVPDKVEKLVVKTNDIDGAPQFAAELQQKLDDAGIPLAVAPWQELSPIYSSVEQFSSVFTIFTYIGVFILVFFSIFEVLTMAFLERKREVGTIRAVGTQENQVFSMFLQEGIILGVLGGVVGIIIGGLLSLWINLSNLTWLPPGTIDPVPVIIDLSPFVAVAALIAAFLSAFLGTLYPAFKNSRRNVVESLSQS